MKETPPSIGRAGVSPEPDELSQYWNELQEVFLTCRSVMLLRWLRTTVSLTKRRTSSFTFFATWTICT